MRIENGTRIGTTAGKPGASRSSGSAFASALEGESSAPARAATTMAANPLYDLTSLMALQAFEDPKERRRRSVKRGLDLIDVLEGVQMDLLVGRVGQDRLELLASMLAGKAPSGDQRLDALVDDIELRVRVELAKFGRYPD
ncbi:MAG: flagellar assembly protein FliX [Ancalomicrobiaceae bacterium]|nr:flagellar assembly protein FliX [Ancalomicrobiaceae bacterium]